MCRKWNQKNKKQFKCPKNCFKTKKRKGREPIPFCQKRPSRRNKKPCRIDNGKLLYYPYFTRIPNFNFNGNVLSCEINILKKIIIHSGIENFLRYSLLDSNGQDVQMAECKQEIIWAYKHPNKKDRKTGKYWFGRMKTVTGVKRKEAKLEDFQRLYKCEGYKADVCNNKGLTYPAKCSSPPCNICLGSKTSMSFFVM